MITRASGATRGSLDIPSENWEICRALVATWEMRQMDNKLWDVIGIVIFILLLLAFLGFIGYVIFTTRISG